MKSERRHELQANQLAIWLRKTYKTIQPYVNLILGIAVLVVVGVIGYRWWNGRSSARAEKAFDAYFAAFRAPEDDRIDLLDSVAKDNPGTDAGQWARLEASFLRLEKGANEMFRDRIRGMDTLEKAVDGFMTAREARQPEIKWQATFGLAEAKESRLEADEARSYYEEVVTKGPDGPYKEKSRERLAALDRAAKGFNFFAKFNEYVPTPEPPGKPDSGDLGIQIPAEPSRKPGAGRSALEGGTHFPQTADAFSEERLEKAGKKPSPTAEKTPAKPPETKTPAKPAESKTPVKPAESKTPATPVDAEAPDAKTKAAGK
jgi:hypothetical protein